MTLNVFLTFLFPGTWSNCINDEIRFRDLLLEYEIQTDSIGDLPRELSFINDTGAYDGEYYQTKLKIHKSVDLQELAARLGLSHLNAIQLHEFFFSFLCVEAKVEASKNVDPPHLEICRGDDVWAALCSRDKNLSFRYAMIGCVKVNNKFNKPKYDDY